MKASERTANLSLAVELAGQLEPPSESYRWLPSKRRLVRTVTRGDSYRSRSSLPIEIETIGDQDLAAEYDRQWLRMKSPLRLPYEQSAPPVRIADLFSGCGAMTLGAVEACRALRLTPQPVFAGDFDRTALSVYGRNFPSAHLSSTPVEEVLDSDLGAEVSPRELAFSKLVGNVDLLVGGPPCQGNSDLNNSTRRADPKNALMAKMARFAELIRPKNVIIENVPGVIHDREGIVDRTRQMLERLGYYVDQGFVDLHRIGVPQSRKRFVLVATVKPFDLARLITSFEVPVRSVRWAIEDLRTESENGLLNTPSNVSAVNSARIDYLFDHDLEDLPDAQRPDCHRNKPHSYNSVYGRLNWDSPSQTITTGFGCMGQGRFVHPSRRRTLTPHEAARLQFFPDFFDLSGVGRTALARIIGNAVPAKLTYVLALALLGESE